MGKAVSPKAHSTTCLRDLVNMIDTIEDELTIYATPEWSPSSAAIAALEPDAGGAPPEAKALGMSYFLEVFIAKEVLEGIKDLDLEARTKRLIQYAVTDA
jgi:hypothetical protein